MYLIIIHVPICVDGARTLVGVDWHRSLLLLRDSMGGRFGPIAVLAPSMPTDSESSQLLEEVNESRDGVRLIPSFDHRCRAREYWSVHRRRWISDVRRWSARARVVHSNFSDLYRPLMVPGTLEPLKQGKPVVFVADTDAVLQWSQLRQFETTRARLKGAVYYPLYERWMRHLVGKANLSLLKGKALYERYERFARNARMFHNSSYMAAEIADEAVVERRVRSLGENRPLRLVYCGRLEFRKGLEDSLKMIKGTVAAGADIRLDIIGDGPDRGKLEEITRESSLTEHIKFLGRRPYGPDLLARLARYDALFFTPVGEDTPRMIFDGYSAGLPLIGSGIRYIRELEESDKAAAIFNVGDIEAGVATLLRLDANRQELAALTEAAMRAASRHSADHWYQQRMEWTVEAVSKHEFAQQAGRSAPGRTAAPPVWSRPHSTT